MPIARPIVPKENVRITYTINAKCSIIPNITMKLVSIKCLGLTHCPTQLTMNTSATRIKKGK